MNVQDFIGFLKISYDFLGKSWIFCDFLMFLLEKKIDFFSNFDVQAVGEETLPFDDIDAMNSMVTCGVHNQGDNSYLCWAFALASMLRNSLSYGMQFVKK